MWIRTTHELVYVEVEFTKQGFKIPKNIKPASINYNGYF